MEPVIGGAIVKTFQWLWKNYGKEFTGKKLDEFKEGKRFEQAAVDYANDMHERYGSIKILGMTSPIPLEGIYTRVSMLDKPSALKRIPKEQLEKVFLQDSHFGETVGEPRNGLDVFFEKKKLYILGKPGAGKTTFLKYIILQTTKYQQKSIPICIELRRFADTGKTLMEYIVEQFDICSFPHAEAFIVTALKHGKALVLCDGLDEVNKENGVRDRVIDQLRDFSDKYNQSRFVITCRIAATEYNFEKFDYVEMADFDKEQIETFIGLWFKNDDKTHKMFLEEFQKAENSRLQNLASSPLLLTLLCLSFKENLSFPSRRSEIYGDALEALMKKWDVTRNITRDDVYRNLSPGRKLNMLARIAAESYEAKDYLIDQDKLQDMIVNYMQTLPQADAPEDIEGEAVLKAVEAQHGILVERTQKLYSFSHKTFQEYLTAKYIVDNAQKGTLKELIDNHLLDDNWKEIILLTAEMLDDADNFFELFYKKLDRLAQEDEKLRWLLQEAERQGAAANFEISGLSKRNIFYIYFFLCLAIARALALNFAHAYARAIDLDLDLAHGRAIDRAIDLGLALARYLVLDLDLALARYRALDLDLARYRDLAHYRDFACINAFYWALETGLAEAYELLSDDDKWDAYSTAELHSSAVAWCRKSGSEEALADLTSIKPPTKAAAKKAQKKYADDIMEFWKKHKLFDKYDLSEEAAKRIEDYLQASKLLLDCLANASVLGRDGLRERLLSPPAGQGIEIFEPQSAGTLRHTIFEPQIKADKSG